MTAVAIRTPARFRLTAPVIPEQDLHESVADALEQAAAAAGNVDVLSCRLRSPAPAVRRQAGPHGPEARLA